MSAHPDHNHGSQLLTNSKETFLCAVADVTSMMHVSMLKDEFMAVMKELHPELADHSLRHWVNDFVKRHKDDISYGA
eukprot:m51a1_g10658 hypothetical protein (77) ;mRNA; r:38597-38827